MAEVKEAAQYETFADQYDSIAAVPQAALESQIITAALGDVTGQKIIDLGGGSGLHAREAITAGAALVDIVDISSLMLGIAERAEQKLGRHDKIRFFQADCTKDISHLHTQGLLEQYDVVMVNWLFDHATSDDDLHGFWRNVSRYAKPGTGRYLGVRMNDPHSHSCRPDNKYGIAVKDITEIPGGFAYYVYVASAKPPLEFGVTSMRKSYTGSTEMHELYGFENVRVLDPRETDVVKNDLSFWQEFLDDPWFACVTAARKKKN